MPLISVIIPTYNSANTIKYCLESLVNQTFTSFEVIILDGLSKDNTIQIASEFLGKIELLNSLVSCLILFSSLQWGSYYKYVKSSLTKGSHFIKDE